VSLLAAGRVTLSFAVVQKNLETEVVVREYRRLDGQNARLSDEVAGLSSSLRVRRIAVKRYGLVTPGAVEYVTARRAAGGATGAAR
jgi:cell division protein FtsL